MVIEHPADCDNGMAYLPGQIRSPGDEAMPGSSSRLHYVEAVQNRRTCLGQLGLAAAACLGSTGSGLAANPQAEPKLSPPEQAKVELERALERVKTATSRPVVVRNSVHYQAVGDASDSFLKIVLQDCEQVAGDFLDYYQAKGFDVKSPGRRLTLIVFREEPAYREFARGMAVKSPLPPAGFCSRKENWLVLYDFRSDPAVDLAVRKNARTLAHETTHQLAWNTGLLNRRGDTPLSIIEGIAGYGETRRLRGRTEPGQKNVMLLDDLAYIQRRVKWVKAADLLTDDAAAFGTTADQTVFGYAESWLLVYHLMKTPRRLVQFQAYLKAIHPRVTNDHRFEDAERHFGDLDRLDQELHATALRLQNDRGPG
jgi:hypothetical protein